MFGRIGIMELIVILAIALLIVGPKRLPQVGGALGSAIREFKNGAKDIQNSLDADLADTNEPAKPAPAKAEPAQLTVEPVQKAAEETKSEE